MTNILARLGYVRVDKREAHQLLILLQLYADQVALTEDPTWLQLKHFKDTYTLLERVRQFHRS